MKTPENTPPGEKYRVRLTVRDETTDGLLANLSAPAIRRSLPGFYMYSLSKHMFTTRTIILTVKVIKNWHLVLIVVKLTIRIGLVLEPMLVSKWRIVSFGLVLA